MSATIIKCEYYKCTYDGDYMITNPDLPTKFLCHIHGRNWGRYKRLDKNGKMVTEKEIEKTYELEKNNESYYSEHGWKLSSNGVYIMGEEPIEETIKSKFEKDNTQKSLF